MNSLLILGASARAAAYSALRAGLKPVGVDLFADLDLTAICPAHRVARADYPHALAAIAATLPDAPWIYTGALENHPELVDRIRRRRALWGNDGATLRAVRDPLGVAAAFRSAGFSVPQVRSDATRLPRDGTWLAKPRHSAAGRGIKSLGAEPPQPTGRPYYFQERIDGENLSAVFVGDRVEARLVGVTRQLIGRPGSEFAYRGSVGPWPLTAPATASLRALGCFLAATFGLVGLFGVDFVLRGGQCFPVEINPRYTASVEVLELALGCPLLAEHRQACERGASQENRTALDQALDRPLVVGKEIVFAPAPCRLPFAVEAQYHGDDLFAIPRAADLPDPGTEFAAGDPVLTVFARGRTPAECLEGLACRRSDWDVRLQEAAAKSSKSFPI